ncbi:MAG: group II intron reverse transcriptase/maturase [Wolbachia endosymbiont of Andrena praecox]|uniref:group II intron reverse transcriptase/maturase n=1 Tax=Wolbachia endosymbiont (group A) of Nomada goodeniana TaxID=3066207 RepID=UPI0029C35C43|nr:group II intron reverse transcriptase/maturase [Wolbachia endosymbiont of Andrena praecox]MDX5497269.1 group II intron reverse transcriptase/maturase [Wolbachia endosymbiont of Lasioglossum nitidulum]MDX5543483.1 group II intron reverse transcriptase/maturase [Wolbachia endosymbiont of Andrena apicata]MEC4734682.1 group II intron reverse transcriptase/maturase [Wolbachia endosymbiont of Halictus tumulorum]
MRYKLNQIAVRAKQDKRLKFTSLVHLINTENLARCYKELKRNKACGVDQITVESYGENLNEKLEVLVESMKRKQYQPQPVKRVYIPKAGSKEKRGLGIPSTEDKLVQIMLKKILENIYEANFLDSSYGFRPGRNCHQAVNALDKAVMYKPINYIVEVDIKKFYDNIQHKWLMRCLRERITDPNLLWLVKRFLKAGIVEAGNYEATKQGTPQGGIVSPVLANIYLHYVLDLWIEKKFKPRSRGYIQLIRFCDDFVVCCESKVDAEEFLELLKQRLNKFGLEVSENKTRVVKFGKREWQRAIREKRRTESFNFLGFTHYGAKSRRGRLMMGHKTSKLNLARKLKEIKEWLKIVRGSIRLKDWWQVLKAKLTGHYNYFGISGNYWCLKQFYTSVRKLAFKWINRRSQKKSMTWEQFVHYVEVNPLPKPKIHFSLYA